MRTDISAAHNQVQLLLRSHGDIISSVSARLKQRLAENEASLLESISQLNSQCSQLSEDKECSKAENKRLVGVIQQMESQHQQSEETNQNILSELKGELNGIKTNTFYIMHDHTHTPHTRAHTHTCTHT